MRTRLAGGVTARLLAAMLLALTMLGISSQALTQDDSNSNDVGGNPVMLGLAVAREVIEEDRGSPLYLVRWRYYEDNWSDLASLERYGTFGIDNCVAGIPTVLKRSDILFGWTFNLLDRSGKEYQARVSYDLAESVVCDEALVPPRYAPAPAPAAETAAADDAAPVAAAAAAASTANVGGFALGGHVASFDGATAALMKSAGMSWVKKQVTHGISDGRDVIAQAHGQGFKVVLGALGNKQQLTDNFDGYIAEFAQYVAFLASNGADAIEVWNEPNIEREWPRGQISGASYVRLLSAAYQAIKAANPATIVISGAPSPTGFFAAGCAAEGCNDDVFVQQMSAAGAANYLDCVGVHYNAGITPPQATSGAPVGSAGHYSWYLPRMMQVYRGAFPGKPLCFTELGYLTGEGIGQLPGGFSWASGNTLQNQVDWLAGAVNVTRGSGYVSMLIVWNVNFTASGADPQGGYAILRPGGGCPACNSLRQAMGG